MIKAAPAAPLARRQRRALPWRPARRTPGHTVAEHADQGRSPGTRLGAKMARLPRSRLSSLPSPPQWRPSGSSKSAIAHQTSEGCPRSTRRMPTSLPISALRLETAPGLAGRRPARPGPVQPGRHRRRYLGQQRPGPGLPVPAGAAGHHRHRHRPLGGRTGPLPAAVGYRRGVPRCRASRRAAHYPAAPRRARRPTGPDCDRRQRRRNSRPRCRQRLPASRQRLPAARHRPVSRARDRKPGRR
jgi:hypothetical protein